jgi:hypothetical protein
MSPKTNHTKENFDIDLAFGEVGEKKVIEMLEGEGSIEVKTERDKWKDTGNIAIEIRFKGKPSGISTTDASTWIHLLSYKGKIEGGFLIEVGVFRKRIKKLLNRKIAKIVLGGDGNYSEMVLVPIDSIFELRNEIRRFHLSEIRKRERRI